MDDTASFEVPGDETGGLLESLPLSAYIALGMLLYLLVVGMLIVLKYALSARGIFAGERDADDDDAAAKRTCGAACLSCVAMVLPCTECSGRSLLNRCCPKDKKLDCARCVTCECLRGVAFGGDSGLNLVCCEVGASRPDPNR